MTQLVVTIPILYWVIATLPSVKTVNVKGLVDRLTNRHVGARGLQFLWQAAVPIPLPNLASTLRFR